MILKYCRFSNILTINNNRENLEDCILGLHNRIIGQIKTFSIGTHGRTRTSTKRMKDVSNKAYFEPFVVITSSVWYSDLI